ncbi:MAG: hypothetical protein PUC12_03115 [Clostridiales bacterium]|nr:hypothetical protein [Clostridiales bacterium]
MINIMKAQLYQLKRTRLIYIVFVCVLIIQFTTMMGEMDFLNSTITAGKYVAENGTAVAFVSLIFALVFTGEVCGADFGDKTTNYELMGGHLRKEVYFSRAILSLGIGTGGALILNAFPVVIACILGDWGNEVRLLDIFLRYLLSVFSIARIICEFIFLSYIIKNAYIVMATGVVISLAGSGWSEMFPNGSPQYTGMGSLSEIFNIPCWATYTLVGEKNIVVYDAALSARNVAGTILSSVLFGGLFLLLGYLYFKKDDLN